MRSCACVLVLDYHVLIAEIKWSQKFPNLVVLDDEKKAAGTIRLPILI